jgi:sodium-dependent dicarboxylate transporter 2/3/5
MGSWLVFFLLGCFGLSEALKVTGFSRRFALWFLTRPFAAGKPWVLLAMFLLGCTAMGGVMSGTITCIVYLTIAISMLEAIGCEKGDVFAAVLTMGIAWTATAALAITPIGHAGNLMAMSWLLRDFGYATSFVQWMIIFIPMGLLVYFIILGLFRYVIRPDVSRFKHMCDSFVMTESSKLGPVSRQEKYAVFVFSMAIVCWMLPGVAGGVLPGLSGYLDTIGYAVPAVMGACVLCLIRVNDKPIMTFNQWMRDGVEWGSLALVAAICVIGDVVSNPGTGIPLFLSGVVEPLVRNVPTFALLLVGMLWVVVQTNVVSNIVSMTMVYSVLVPIAANTQVADPVALGAVIAAASNYAFSLPSATTATAIVVGSGWVPVRFMAKYGLLMIVPVVLLFTFVAYPFARLVLR